MLTSRGVRPELLLVVWSLHCGLTREAAAQIAGLARSTVERDVRLYRDGGLNLIERQGEFTKRRSLYGRYHPTFADVLAAIEYTLIGITTTHAE